MLQALRFAIHHVRQDDNMVMFIGPDARGYELVDVGVVIWWGGGLPLSTPCGQPETSTDGDLMRPLLADLIANADRLADAFENDDLKPDDFDTPLPPLMAVKLAAFRRAAAGRSSPRPSTRPATPIFPGAS